MGKFHISTQILQGNALFFEKNYECVIHSWKYFYATAGRDGRDKFQVCRLMASHKDLLYDLTLKQRPQLKSYSE